LAFYFVFTFVLLFLFKPSFTFLHSSLYLSHHFLFTFAFSFLLTASSHVLRSSLSCSVHVPPYFLFTPLSTFSSLAFSHLSFLYPRFPFHMTLHYLCTLLFVFLFTCLIWSLHGFLCRSLRLLFIVLFIYQCNLSSLFFTCLCTNSAYSSSYF
jgi:hypothetical protein